MQDFSWIDIYADLNTQTVSTSTGDLLPKVNLYFEDAEGQDFFNHLIFRTTFKKYTKSQKDVTLGCTNYAQLIKAKVPEFASKSIVILDGDIPAAIKKHASVLALPGHLPPDQLIFEYLYNLPANDTFWVNTIRFNKPLLTSIGSEILVKLNINNQNPIDLKSLINQYQLNNNDDNRKKLRKVFKEFYKNTQFQQLLKLKGLNNPWKRWISENKSEAEDFKTSFKTKLRDTFIKGWGVEQSNIPINIK